MCASQQAAILFIQHARQQGLSSLVYINSPKNESWSFNRSIISLAVVFQASTARMNAEFVPITSRDSVRSRSSHYQQEIAALCSMGFFCRNSARGTIASLLHTSSSHWVLMFRHLRAKTLNLFSLTELKKCFHAICPTFDSSRE